MAQATAGSNSGGANAVPPYRLAKGQYSLEGCGLHTFFLALRGEFISPLFSVIGDKRHDTETGEPLRLIDRHFHKQLVHSGNGVAVLVRRTRTGLLLVIEGVASNLLGDNNLDDHLVDPRRMNEIEVRARELAGRMGISIPPDEPAFVHRADLATDLRLGDAELAQSMLRSFRDRTLPRCRGVAHARLESPLIETVYWKSAAAGIVARVYDRQAKGGDDRGPGEVLRLEAQHRPDRPARERTPAEFSKLDHAQLYVRAFRHWLKNSTVAVREFIQPFTEPWSS